MRRLLWRSSVVLGIGICALFAPSQTRAEDGCGPFCATGPAFEECSIGFLEEWCPVVCGTGYNGNGWCWEDHPRCEDGLYFKCFQDI